MSGHLIQQEASTANRGVDESPRKSQTRSRMLSCSVALLVDGDLGHWIWKVLSCFECYSFYL